MNDEQQKDNDGNWIASLVEGGLPKLLGGPAVQAISRLIGVGFDIPSAWLEGFSQAIRDRTVARSEFSKAVAAKATDKIANDPEMLERAIGSFLGRECRSQINREAVAKLALQEIIETPPLDKKLGPSEEWMGKFERYAGEVASEDLRLMFAKILCGEIRSPGAIAPSTLHFVSNLDAETAVLINRVLPYSTFEGVAYLDAVKERLMPLEETYIEQSGFWTSGKHISFQVKPERRLAIKIKRDESILISAGKEMRLGYNIAALSRAGRDLLEVVNPDFDYQAVAENLASEGVKQISKAKVSDSGGKASYQNEVIIWRDGQKISEAGNL